MRVANPASWRYVRCSHPVRTAAGAVQAWTESAGCVLACRASGWHARISTSRPVGAGVRDRGSLIRCGEDMTNTAITRRELLRRSGDVGGALALPMLLRAEPSTEGNASATASPTGLRLGPDIYQSIGVRPLINARGTFTIISGSLMLPEVRAAMAAAAQQLRASRRADRGHRRASGHTDRRGMGPGHVRLRGGADPRHRGLRGRRQSRPPRPDPEPERAFAKDEVIIPKHSRNVYDAALRAVGVRVIEVVDAGRARGRASAPAPRWSTSWPARTRTRARSAASAIAPLAQARRRARAGRRRRRDPDRAQRPPAERRHARRLQRRQVPARAADGRPAARDARTW